MLDLTNADLNQEKNNEFFDDMDIEIISNMH